MDLDPLNCTCLHLRAATRRLTQRYDQALAPIGLRTGQFSILSLVEAWPNVNVTQLSEFLDMDISTATRNLRPLVTEGLLAMNAVREDARRRELSLTAKGKRLVEKARVLWSGVQSRVAGELGERRHAQLHALLGDLR
jgi:DNA-binding MarR family transcriptional regulator